MSKSQNSVGNTTKETVMTKQMSGSEQSADRVGQNSMDENSVKSIQVRVQVDATGIVNYDSSDQKYSWNAMIDRNAKIDRDQGDKGIFERKAFNDNVSFGKALYREQNGRIVRDPYISSDCMKRAAFGDDLFQQNPNVMHETLFLVNRIASPQAMLHGYLYTQTTGGTVRRKSAVTLTDAICDLTAGLSCPALTISTTSEPKSGVATEGKNEDSDGSTSMRFKEVRGKERHIARATIDIPELFFFSLSDNHDRLALDPDLAADFARKLGGRIGSEVSAPSFYMRSGEITELPEYGIAFSEEQVIGFIRYWLRRMAMTEIRRNNGFGFVTKLEVKFVRDSLQDLFSEKEGWITIRDVDFDGTSVRKIVKFDDSCLNNISLQQRYYAIDDQEMAKKLVGDFAAKIKAHNADKAAANQENRLKKEAAKAAKAAAKAKSVAESANA